MKGEKVYKFHFFPLTVKNRKLLSYGLIVSREEKFLCYDWVLEFFTDTSHVYIREKTRNNDQSYIFVRLND